MTTFSRCIALSAACAALAVAAPAKATVDAILDYTIVYEEPQTGDYCYRTLPVFAEIGIPSATMMDAVYAPTQILNQNGRPSRYININKAAPPVPMRATYVNDGVDADGVFTYDMRVDVAALSAANSVSLVGRTKTITSAKLGLLAMAKSLGGITDNRFKLRVTFVGLPSQSGLSGSPVNATTSYPYTSGSPLLAAYERELINAGGTCR